MSRGAVKAAIENGSKVSFPPSNGRIEHVVNGRTHAVIGASLVPLSVVTTGMEISEAAVLTAVAAGFSLGPDIDHPNATISRASPRFVHEMFHGLSEVVIRLASTKSDRMHMMNASKRGIDIAHRTLTHTLIFSVGIGGLAYAFAHTATGTAILAFLSVMACRALLGKKREGHRSWFFALTMGAALGVASIAFFSAIPAEHVALAAWMGWVSHIIADCCTRAGVPVLWPLKIKGRRWWRLRLLGGWLTSGDTKEWVAALGVMAAMNMMQWMLIL